MFCRAIRRKELWLVTHFSFIVVDSFCFVLVFYDLIHDVCVCVCVEGGGGLCMLKGTAKSIQKSFDYE